MSKLWIEIEATDQEPWEVRCNNRLFDFNAWLICKDGKIVYESSRKLAFSDESICSQCKGTGTRKVALVGMVEIDETNAAGVYAIHYSDSLEYEGSLKFLYQRILQDHRAGKLSRELYKSDENPRGLYELEVD